MPDVLPLRLSVPEPPADPAATPHVDDARRLAVLLGVGVRTVRTWDAAGRLPAPVRIGGRVVWRIDEVRTWLYAGAPDRDTWAARRAARAPRMVLDGAMARRAKRAAGRRRRSYAASASRRATALATAGRASISANHRATFGASSRSTPGKARRENQP